MIHYILEFLQQMLEMSSELKLLWTNSNIVEDNIKFIKANHYFKTKLTLLINKLNCTKNSVAN